MTDTAIIRTTSWDHRLNLLAPSPADIRLVDVAQGLARSCRYARMSPVYYSVAEHSWLMAAGCVHYYADLLVADPKSFNRLQLRCMTHDGSEAYLWDAPGPIKMHVLLAGYRELERRLQDVVYQHFGLKPKCPDGHELRTHLLDRTILCEEMGVLWSRSPDDVKKEFDLVAFAKGHGVEARLCAGERPRFPFGVQGIKPSRASILYQRAMEEILNGGVFRGFPEKGGMLG